MSTPTSTHHQVLQDVFGYPDFRPGQADVIGGLLAGRHMLAVMPTGAGKSLCYQVPALVRGGLTVVVSPLIALMQDQVNALRLNGVAADSINSASSRADNVAAWRRAQAGETRLLYMAPERLMTPRMLEALGRLPISFFAIDEAHCISQWGHSFRAEYLELGQLRQTFPKVPIAALTATADRATRDEIVEKVFGGKASVFVAGFDRPNLHLAVAQKHNPKHQLLTFIDRHEGAAGIVYCLSRKKVDETAQYLQDKGFKALAYHAGMEPAAREACQNRFLSEPGVIIVATIAFGMGIDKPDVRFVMHMDIPGSIEAYYQEIGRAGRDGAAAEVLMLYGLDDIRMRRMFVDRSEAGDAKKRVEHRRLDALINLCETPGCRRKSLLAYFSETTDDCKNCDRCDDPVEVVDGTALALQVLKVVEASEQRFGVGHIIDILTGKATEKVERFRHDRLDVFGIGIAKPKAVWQSLIRQMVAAGCLAIDVGGYGSLLITANGQRVLDGLDDFSMRLDSLKPKKASAEKRRGSSSDEPVSQADQGLFGELKSLRLSLAKERDVPAYVIFPDRALQDMARKRPANIDEFAKVHGVGQAKLRDFGTAFLEAILASEG